MREKDAVNDRSRREGLGRFGPLFTPLSTVKVGFRPQSRLLQEKVHNVFSGLKDKGRVPIQGTFVSVRTMEGFCHFPDVKNLVEGNCELKECCFTVVDYDPTRRNFCICGDGEASIALEVSWFCLRTFSETMIVVGVPIKDGDAQDVPDNDKLRLDHYLNMLRSWRSSERIVSAGYELLRSNDLRTIGEGSVWA